jgi:hypothetical protein
MWRVAEGGLCHLPAKNSAESRLLEWVSKLIGLRHQSVQTEQASLQMDL